MNDSIWVGSSNIQLSFTEKFHQIIEKSFQHRTKAHWFWEFLLDFLNKFGVFQSTKCFDKEALISNREDFFASFTFAIGVQPSYSYLNNGFFYLDRIGLESVKHFFFPLLFISWRKADVEVSSILCIYSNFIGSYFSLRKRHFMVWKKSCN